MCLLWSPALAPRLPRPDPEEPVAQLVEQLTFNQRVAGSNPAGLTNETKYLATVRVRNAGFSFVRGNAGVTSARSVPLRWKGNAGVGVADRYGSPRARIKEARDALTAAMDHLGDVDSAIYSEGEKLK